LIHRGNLSGHLVDEIDAFLQSMAQPAEALPDADLLSRRTELRAACVDTVAAKREELVLRVLKDELRLRGAEH